MPARFSSLVLRVDGLCEHAFDALGRKVELHEGDTAVERFPVMGDQLVAKIKAADAFKQVRASGTLRES